jgi:HEAT repeat protein
VIGGILWAVAGGAGDPGRGSAPAFGSDVDGALAAIEERLEERVAAIEARLLMDRGAARGADLEASDPADGEPPDPLAETVSPDDRVARLERRMDDLELRFRAAGDDPVLRGHTYLESQSARMRAQGIELLARFARSDPEARRAIRAMLHDADADVRRRAVEALASARDRESVTEILSLLGDANSGVRQEAIDALDELLEGAEDPAALADAAAAVLPSLADPDRRLRETAAETLGDLRAREGVPHLLRLLADPEGDVRENAVEALGEIGDPAAVPALRELYARSEGDDALRVALSLQELGDPSAMAAETARLREIALASPDPESREDAVEFLADHGAAFHRDVFERALADPHPDVREQAEQGLRRLQRGEERERRGGSGERREERER